MKEFIIKSNEAGQRLDKMLFKIFNRAPQSFIYKMLRKKNFTLNNKKALGSEILIKGDIIRIFLSDETYKKFTFADEFKSIEYNLDIIYEDKNIIILNKPLGLLSQKSQEKDISINDYLLSYLLDTKQIMIEEFSTFKPSICNRLDRNTSGLIVAGKTLIGLQEINYLFRERKIDKTYITIVSNEMKDKIRVKSYISKDLNTNKVKISTSKSKNSKEIISEYEPIDCASLKIKDKTIAFTLVKVKIITGRTHQIRAHLSYINHPVIGDYKYGNKFINEYFNEKYKLNSQLLHANSIFINSYKGSLSYLSNKEFKADFPKSYLDIIKDIFN